MAVPKTTATKCSDGSMQTGYTKDCLRFLFCMCMLSSFRVSCAMIISEQQYSAGGQDVGMGLLV